MKAITFVALAAASVAALAQGPYSKGGSIDKATMAKLEKAEKAAEAALKKSPKSQAVKTSYTDALNRHALACMNSNVYGQKVKYRMALADFRKVLKVDPKNKVAKSNFDMLVNIYKSMGRPVPQ